MGADRKTVKKAAFFLTFSQVTLFLFNIFLQTIVHSFLNVVAMTQSSFVTIRS